MKRLLSILLTWPLPILAAGPGGLGGTPLSPVPGTSTGGAATNIIFNNPSGIVTVVTNSPGNFTLVVSTGIVQSLSGFTNGAGNGVSVTNIPFVGLQQPFPTYRYLGIVPVNLNVGIPASFGFKGSFDGTNWHTLQLNSSYLETAATAHLYAPSIVYYAGNFIVAYDAFALDNANPLKWGLGHSADLYTWTRDGIQTLGFTGPSGPLFGTQFFTDTDGSVYQYFPVNSTPTKPFSCVVATPNVDGTVWTTRSSVATNVADMCVLHEGNTYWMFQSDASSKVNIMTNTTGPTNTFYTFLSDLFIPDALESPQVIKLHPNDWIMYIQSNPSRITRTFYSKSTDLVHWTSLQPINEDGVSPGRMNVIELTPTTETIIQSLVNSNQASLAINNTYCLTTTPSVLTVTSQSRPIGGEVSGSIEYRICAIGEDTDNGSDYAKFDIVLGLGAEGGAIPSLQYPLYTNYTCLIRPSSAWKAEVVFSGGVVNGNGVTGYTVGPQIKVTGPSGAETIYWTIEEIIHPVARPSSVVDIVGGYGYQIASIGPRTDINGVMYGNGGGLTNIAGASNNIVYSTGLSASTNGSGQVTITSSIPPTGIQAKRITTSVVQGTGASANVTDLSVSLTSGHKYIFNYFIVYTNSGNISVTRSYFTFNGGGITTTTDFNVVADFASQVGSGNSGPYINSLNRAALATEIPDTGGFDTSTSNPVYTGQTGTTLIVKFTGEITPSQTGTLIPKFGFDGVSGQMTLMKGSYATFVETSN